MGAGSFIILPPIDHLQFKQPPRYDADTSDCAVNTNNTVSTTVGYTGGDGGGHKVNGGINRAASTLSRASVEGPGWRANMKGDYDSGNVRVIATQDLLCWMFQV